MKKIIVISVIICAIVIIGIALYFSQEETILKDIDISDIERIELWPNSEPAILTTEDDIEEVLNVLQSITLKKSFNDERAGGMRVYIYFNNSEKMSVTVLSKDIYIDGDTYKYEEDCVDKLREMYIDKTK